MMKNDLHKILVTNIVWDTDGEDIQLPLSMEIQLSEINIEDISNRYEVEDMINNYLSDKTGWLVCTYLYQII